MKIEIIDDTVAQKKIVKKGEILDIDAHEANLLIRLKKAVKVETIEQEQASEMVEAGEAVVPPEAIVEEEKPKKKNRKGKQ